MAVSDDKFMVFISHKHDDHELADDVKHAIESLNKKVIECFVSGIDITAGMDWRREIRGALARSHMLLLLFTAPSKNWDWCLYETGLYTRFDKADVRAVVCLFNPGKAAPSPLADLQGVPAKRRQDSRLPRHALPQDVDDLRRLAPGRARRRHRGGEGEGGGGSHRRGVPSFGLDVGVLSVPSRGPVAVRLTTTSRGHPGERAGHGRPERHLGVHHVAVRPGWRNRPADVGRPVARRGRDRCRRGARARRALPAGPRGDALSAIVGRMHPGRS